MLQPSFFVVYPNKQLEMVIKAHEEGFKFSAGCCKKGIYDNMKTVVKEILIGCNELSKSLQDSSLHIISSIEEIRSMKNMTPGSLKEEEWKKLGENPYKR